MKKILVLGAGRSATTLIRYLDTHAAEGGWKVTVADADRDLLASKLKGLWHTSGQVFVLSEAPERAKLIIEHDFVISLLPWTLHTVVAKDCLRLGRHLITASYVTPEMIALSKKAHRKGLFFMGELGLDPGLDHMSALALIERIKGIGGQIHSFHSYAGGLIAEESDNNPWHYKFTWNPRNVVLAGQGIAQFRENGRVIFQPYNRLFSQAEPIEIAGMDRFEVYPNRDSLKYISLYGLEGIPSIMRGTVRFRGFCKAWDALIRLGLTEGTSPLEVSEGMTWKDLIAALLPSTQQSVNIESALAEYLGLDGKDPVMDQLIWLGLTGDEPVGKSGQTAADLLQQLLEAKWTLATDDKDLVVMEHRLQFDLHGTMKELRSSLVYKGRDQQQTAMADLVGLPLAVTAHLFLTGNLPLPNMAVPFEARIYEPLLKALSAQGIYFQEQELEPQAFRSPS